MESNKENWLHVSRDIPQNVCALRRRGPPRQVGGFNGLFSPNEYDTTRVVNMDTEDMTWEGSINDNDTCPTCNTSPRTITLGVSSDYSPESSNNFYLLENAPIQVIHEQAHEKKIGLSSFEHEFARVAALQRWSNSERKTYFHIFSKMGLSNRELNLLYGNKRVKRPTSCIRRFYTRLTNLSC